MGAPCRHTLQCTVLHQLRLVVTFCKQAHHRTENGRNNGVGHLQVLHAIGSTGGDSLESHPEEATAGNQQPISGTSQALRTNELNAPVTGSTSAGPDPKVDESSSAETRRGTGLAEKREELRPLLSSRRAQLLTQLHESLTTPLRTVLLGCLLQELLARAQRVVATQEGRDTLTKAQWIDAQGAWNYLRWSSQHRKLVINEEREPLTHDEIVRTLNSLHNR